MNRLRRAAFSVLTFVVAVGVAFGGVEMLTAQGPAYNPSPVQPPPANPFSDPTTAPPTQRSDDPFGDIRVAPAANAVPAPSDADDDDGPEPEPKMVVVRDVEKLPAQLKQLFEQLPEAERTRIHSAIRKVGMKIPAAMLQDASDENTPDAAHRRQAMALLTGFTNIKQFTRSTSDILTARGEQIAAAAKRAAAAKTATKDTPRTVEELLASGDDGIGFPGVEEQLVAGDWAGIQAELAAMPEPAADQVYTVMLGLLAANGETVAPSDVLALAEAAPRKLSRRQIAMLGRLLDPALQKVDRPGAFLAQLRRGGTRLGDSNMERRAATARLLIAVKLLDEAVTYLMPLEKALADVDVDQLNLHGLILLRKTQADTSPAAIRRAWELTRLTMDKAPLDSPAHRELLQRAASMLAKAPRELTGPWLRSLFDREPMQGFRILAIIARGLETANQQPVDPDALKCSQMALRELAPVARDKPDLWASSRQLMVLQWAALAQAAVGNGSTPNDSNQQRPSLPPAVLLSLGPDDACMEGMDAEIVWPVIRLRGILAARAGNKESALATVKAFEIRDPKVARQLAEDFLANWVTRLSSNGSFDANSNPFGNNNGGGNGGIPLTRSRQVRNLAQFRALLAEFHALGAPPLGAEAIVSAFGACHSPAEVYREEDIVSAFGPIASLDGEVAARLANAMRENLAGQWRNPSVQDAQGTHRTDPEIIAEIERGYTLALSVLKRSAARESVPQQLLMLMGAIEFDNAEFLYGQQADLPTYVKARDRAFASYRRAHEIYAKKLAKLPAEQHSAAIYRQWFQSALGASDLTMVSAKEQSNGDQIKQIAAAIRSLGGPAAEEHLQLFAKELGESLNQVPPHMKPWFMREALRVLGNGESGRPFRQLVDFYQDLLGEIELHVELDGNRQVGREPFGAQVVVRGTTAVIREAGGFASLLAPSTSAATGQPIDRKEKLEKEIRERLAAGFEILQIRFHEPNVGVRTFGRDGWREMPLAYVVLRAKDSAVDRLVPLQLDLEFNDGHGIVVLPVNSEPELIDARANPAAARPLVELKVKQTLDDRKLAENVLRLEIAATGKGLIPDLSRVLKIGSPGGESQVPGFVVTSALDHGLSIGSLSSDGPKVQPICERRWTVELAPRDGARPAEFHFPAAATKGAELTFARFDDADLSDVASVVPLHGWPSTSSDWLPFALSAAGAALLAAIAMILFRIRRARQLRNVSDPKYRLPEHVTPFNAVALLRRLGRDSSCSWTPAEQSDLAAEIGRIEDRYFARGKSRSGSNENGNDELDRLLKPWLSKASL